MKTIFDGVDAVQIAGLGVLALLPMVTYSLMKFAVTRSHRWDFIEGFAKTAAALVVSFNVCAVAWYLMKFINKNDFATIAIAVLGLAWYLCWSFLTCMLFPAFGRGLQRWAASKS